MSHKVLSFEPYLMFEGNCEEALNFYSEILNGKVTIIERYNNPAMDTPKDYQDKVLHANLKFGDYTILASDVFPGSKAVQGTGDASLAVTLKEVDQGKKVFDRLAEGGQVNMLFEKQFWGAWHGNLQDKYGINWNINSNA